MKKRELFDAVLEQRRISVQFQPVVHLGTAEVIGYEALARGPENTALSSPLALLAQARGCGRLCELETLIKKTALLRAREACIGTTLFLNVEPSLLADPAFRTCFVEGELCKYGISPERIVLELTERETAARAGAFYRGVRWYRQNGFSFAVDDIGMEGGNPLSFMQTGARYFKLGPDMVRGIESDAGRQATVRTLAIIAGMHNAWLIAIGVETKRELETLIRLGVFAGQGYFLAPPEDGPTQACRAARDVILSPCAKGSRKLPYAQYIGEISESLPAFDIGTTCGKIRGEMERHRLEGVCLLCHGDIAGIIMKRRLDEVMSAQFGFALFAEKPVNRLMDSRCLMADYYVPIREVADMVLARPQEKIYDNVVVTRGGVYYGMVTVINLLKYAMEIETKHALSCNPLTQLPGNRQISTLLAEQVEREETAAVLYFDLNHFKAYNDVYGFGKGDTLIVLTKNVIEAVMQSFVDTKSFVGHIGGDDFVAILHGTLQDCMGVCREIIRRFDRSVPDYYSEADRERGYIIAEDRGHRLRTFPITQIAVAGVWGDCRVFPGPDELAARIAGHKKAAKQIAASGYAIEELSTGHLLTSGQKQRQESFF